MEIKKIQSKVELDVNEQGCWNDCVYATGKMIGKTEKLMLEYPGAYACVFQIKQNAKGNIFW